MKAIDLFKKTISRSEEMLATHEGAYKRGRPERDGVGDDLLRSIIVFSLSSFDAYLHKRVVEVVLKIISSKKRVPDKVIPIIISQLQRQGNGEKDIKAIRELLGIAINKDPITKIKQLLEKGLSKQTFQKSDDVARLGVMMEVEEIWGSINNLIMLNKKGPRKKGKKPNYANFLDKFAERRDMIVHESDTYSSKKHHGKLRKITRTEVRDGIKKLKKIAEAIEKITIHEK